MKGMSMRERFLRCMHFEPVDRPPNYELGYWKQTVQRWLKEGMAPEAYPWLGGFDEEGKALESWMEVPEGEELGPLYGHKYFGIEQRPALPINLSNIPPFEYKVIQESKRYVLFRDEKGRLRKALKVGTVGGTRMSMDAYMDFPVKNRKDFEEIKKRYNPHDPRRYPDNWCEIVARYSGDRKVPVCLVKNGGIGLYSKLRQWMGTVGISKAFFRQPRLVHDMLDFITDFIVETVKKAIRDVHADYFNFFEDFAHKGGPHISPRLFKEFFLPRYRRITKFLRGNGIDIIWLDSDGDVRVLIPLLLEAGITCLWPLEIASGMEPEKIREEYGHQLALSGGVDKRALFGNKKSIERELSKIPELIADGGYIPTIDHSVPPEVSYKNWLYYLEYKMNLMEQA